ncbi:MAG: class I SAM-dependent methyltransferase [Anaerohalosphaeraceae bacterium]|nr:class I SAM-dependent methyltransferase [Anaerohalosphaeraceae bacterium]
MLKKLVLNKFLAGLFIKPLARLHSATYRWVSRYAIVLNDGFHPKHTIIDYALWFTSHIESGQTVLDIGSNHGKLTKALSQRAGFVYGIELSAKLVAQAKARNSADNIEYICADATEFDYSKIKLLDYIVLSNVLEHIENRVSFLRKIIGQVSRRGPGNLKVLIRVPAVDRDWLVAYKKQLGVEWRLDKTHFTEYTIETLASELAAAGLKILESETHFGEIYVICEHRAV